jgi:N-methylhydantoinase B
VLFHTIRNHLAVTAREMALAISRSAYSALISGTNRATGDCDAAILTTVGELVATDDNSVVHLASLPTGLKFVLEKFPLDSIRDGDVFINNDPHHGGLHSNDTMIFRPLFHEGALVFWVTAMAHITDVGGMSPGGMSFAATSVFGEGIVIPPMKLSDAGVDNPSVIEFISANSRQPVETTGDLLALMAGVNVGSSRVRTLLARYSIGTVMEVVEESFAHTERVARHEISRIPDGVYSSECWVDDDGIDLDRHYVVKAQVTVAGDRLTVDMGGTSAQARGPINSSYAQTLTGITYAVRCFVGRGAPLNEGLWRAYDVHLPFGTVVYPAPPAACNTRMSSTTPSVVEAILWALAPVAPNGVGIAGSGVPDVHAINPRGDGEYWLHFEAEWGGAGARSTRDGVDSGGTPMLGSGGGMIPVETQELMYDYRCERYELVPDSGGPGRQRGGLGVRKDYRFQRECSVSARTDRWVFPPAGASGGEAGAPGSFLLERADGSSRSLPSKFAEVAVGPGDLVSFRTMGGGGYGSPYARPPAEVLEDVRSGKVSVEAARERYGVVVVASPSGDKIDQAATTSIRAGKVG